MPYATNGGVSRADMSDDPAWVEITDEQYAQALAGMQSGKIISIEDGFALVDPPEPHEPPLPEPESPGYLRFTALQMLDLFTEAEQLAVVQATMSVPEVKLWYDRLLAADFVTYEDPRVESGLQALVGAELLTVERKAAIVTAMQPPAE